MGISCNNWKARKEKKCNSHPHSRFHSRAKLNGFLSASLKSSCTLTQSIQFWTFDNENHAQLNKRIGTSERKPELWLCIKRYGRSVEQEKASQCESRDNVLPRLEIHSVYLYSALCTTEGSTHSIQSRPCPGPSKTLVIAAVSKSLKLAWVLQVENQKSYPRLHRQALAAALENLLVNCSKCHTSRE